MGRKLLDHVEFFIGTGGVAATGVVPYRPDRGARVNHYRLKLEAKEAGARRQRLARDGRQR